MSEYCRFDDSAARAVLYLNGALSACHAPEVRAAALAAKNSAKPLLLDCSSADHLHAAVLQVLVALRTELIRAQTPFELSPISPAVKDCLQAAGLSGLFVV
jgi:anti-anti-sigma regulatory factor